MVSPLLDLPDEEKPYKFVLQWHHRGRSIHSDLRFEMDDHLVGLTLDDPGSPDKSPKMINEPGMNSMKILTQVKARQPKDWLSVEGGIEPGEIGATRNLPAKFEVKDSGTYEMGSQKANLFEVFLNGKKFDGRWIARLLPRSGKWEEAGKTPMVWFFWKPEDQTPYVLARRSINQMFVPPQGRSALPDYIKKQIPTNLRWYEKGLTGEKAILLIEEARKFLLKRKLINPISDDFVPGKGKLSKTKFVLQKLSWKGQDVIRGTPIVQWHLRFNNDSYFDIDRDIIFDEMVVGVLKKETSTENQQRFNFDGQVLGLNENKNEALKVFNPNKEIPSNVKIEDSGDVDTIEFTKNFASFKFHGQKLKGYFVARSSDGVQYIFSKSSLPEPSKHSYLNPEQIKQLEELTRQGKLSLSEIADRVGCSRDTVHRLRAKFR